MILHVIRAHYRGGHRMELWFNDGVHGIANLIPERLPRGPVFEPLHNPDYFAQGVVDPELQTLAWPNGADLAPEFLEEHVLIEQTAKAP